MAGSGRGAGTGGSARPGPETVPVPPVSSLSLCSAGACLGLPRPLATVLLHACSLSPCSARPPHRRGAPSRVASPAEPGPGPGWLEREDVALLPFSQAAGSPLGAWPWGRGDKAGHPRAQPGGRLGARSPLCSSPRSLAAPCLPAAPQGTRHALSRRTKSPSSRYGGGCAALREGRGAGGLCSPKTGRRKRKQALRGRGSRGVRLPGALPKPRLCYWGCERTQGRCRSRAGAG